MKPYVVIIKEMDNNKIIMSADELKRLVESAYNDGYTDGTSRYWWYQQPYTWYSNQLSSTSEHITITCNTENGENYIL